MNTALASLVSFTWEQLSPDVQRCVKQRLLNHLGAAIAGTQTPEGMAAVRFADRLLPGEGATVLGSPRTGSVLGAAFANATLASALDVDDGYRLAAGHPGAVVIPAALAVGERTGARGGAFLTAVVVGYELATRTGALMYRDNPTRFFGSGAWASAGAAGACATLLGLGVDGVAQALGVTEAHTPLAPNMKTIACGSMVKESIGWGSLTGVGGAFLVYEGFTGPTPVLLEPQNHREASELGSRFRILETYLKPYACCRWAHPAVEGLREILSRVSLDLDSVAEVHVATFRKALSLGDPAPANAVAAQYSLPFVLAAYMVDGEVGPRQIIEGFRRADLRQLARCVHLEEDPDLDALFPQRCLARVRVVMGSGEVHSSKTVGCRGDADRPLCDDEIMRLYRWLSVPVVGEEAARHLADTVERLDELPLAALGEAVRALPLSRCRSKLAS